MLELPLSLTGFLFGLVLSLLAPEELKPGRKYFLLIKKILFYSLILFPLFLSIHFKNYYFVLIPLIFLIIKNLVNQKFLIDEIFNYSFFILIFILFLFLDLNNNLLIILASLIFLYGLPAGTLFRLALIEEQEKKYQPRLIRKEASHGKRKREE